MRAKKGLESKEAIDCMIPIVENTAPISLFMRKIIKFLKIVFTSASPSWTRGTENKR